MMLRIFLHKDINCSNILFEKANFFFLLIGLLLLLFSVQLSHSVVSDSLWPHGLQHTRPPVPSPGLAFQLRELVHHQLPEVTQIHVYWVGDAIQPSHPLSSPSPSTFNLSHIRIFSNELVLCIRWPKYWSLCFSISPSKNIQDWFPLGWTGWISLQSKGLSRVFSNTTVQKHQFFGIQLSL